MTSLKWLPAMAGFCTLILPLQGQTNDWLSVEKLGRGTSISVVRHFRRDARRDCELVKVTDSELACYDWERDRTLVVARAQVREVRLEEPDNNRMITGAIIGAAAGGLLGFLGGGQVSDPEGRAYARFYGIPIGAFVGGAIGRHVHRHGAVVYRRP